jgi:hypothetical protein
MDRDGTACVGIIFVLDSLPYLDLISTILSLAAVLQGFIPSQKREEDVAGKKAAGCQGNWCQEGRKGGATRTSLFLNRISIFCRVDFRAWFQRLCNHVF